MHASFVSNGPFLGKLWTWCRKPKFVHECSYWYCYRMPHLNYYSSNQNSNCIDILLVISRCWHMLHLYQMEHSLGSYGLGLGGQYMSHNNKIGTQRWLTTLSWKENASNKISSLLWKFHWLQNPLTFCTSLQAVWCSFYHYCHQRREGAQG